MTEPNATITDQDRERLDELMEFVEEHTEGHVSHIDWDKAEFTVSLHELDETSEWSRLVHQMKDADLTPHEVRSKVAGIEDFLVTDEVEAKSVIEELQK